MVSCASKTGEKRKEENYNTSCCHFWTYCSHIVVVSSTQQSIQNFLCFSGIQYLGSCNDPKIIKSNFTTEWFGESSKRVTVRLQWEPLLQGKLIELQGTKWEAIKKPFATITGWVTRPPLLYCPTYPVAATGGTVRQLTCVFPAQLPVQPWRTRISTDQQRTKVNSCSRHLQGECDVEKQLQDTDGVSWLLPS